MVRALHHNNRLPLSGVIAVWKLHVWSKCQTFRRASWSSGWIPGGTKQNMGRIIFDALSNDIKKKWKIGEGLVKILSSFHQRILRLWYHLLRLNLISSFDKWTKSVTSPKHWAFWRINVVYWMRSLFICTSYKRSSEITLVALPVIWMQAQPCETFHWTPITNAWIHFKYAIVGIFVCNNVSGWPVDRSTHCSVSQM